MKAMNAKIAKGEEPMQANSRPWQHLVAPLALAVSFGMASAAELNPAAVTYKLPDQIPWGPVNAASAARSTSQN